MTVSYGTVSSNFKPKVWYVGTVSFKKCTSECYIGTVQIALQLVWSMHIFNLKKSGTVHFALIKVKCTVCFKNLIEVH